MHKALLPAGLLLILASCHLADDWQHILEKGIPFPSEEIVTLDNGTKVLNGGFGSSLTAHPEKAFHFYALTDRGPAVTFEGSAGKGKKFPVPDFTPTIGLFRITKEGTIRLLEKIPLKNPRGEALTGLPNPEGRGYSDEIPYDNDGNRLELDDYGLDGEGLVAMRNGDFWIADEYGPHIVHFDHQGKELERISPVGVDTGTRKLPAVLKRRRPGRGMEGLTISPDGKTLIGIMQSTLYNPSKKEIQNKKLCRIVTFDIEKGTTKQYLYIQEENWNANSEIKALSPTTFLVIERDTKFPGEEEAMKRIYKIDLSEATDVSGDFDSPGGLLLNGKTLEQCSAEELAEEEIKTATKELIVDMVHYLPDGFPHDKLEGIWYINATTLAAVNDDDFSVTVEDGEVVQKILPGTDRIDSNTLYIIRLKNPL